jgi:hypothetical protein
MSYIFASLLLLLVAYPMVGSTFAMCILVASQAFLLLGQITRRQVTGAGAFIFMSFLFFGVRPVYLVLENDLWLFQSIYRITVSMDEIGIALWWGTLAMICFASGAALFPITSKPYLLRRRKVNALPAARPFVAKNTALLLLATQAATLPVMLVLSRSGTGLYSSGFGAYAYDLPVPMQAVHVFSIVVILERFLRQRNAGAISMLVVSSVLFLSFTWLMRDVSSFRGFYLTGVMIVGIAVVMRLKGRATYTWLILPIILFQPLFQYLGAQRGMKNEELAQVDVVDQVLQDRTLLQAYWEFYDSKGDMNIFDTFVAAYKYEPKWYPYAWSWLYVPLHWVPRAIWQSKPKKGITMDAGCTRGAPTSPGIAGFFLLDGGLLWMLLSMAVLGYLLSWMDWYALTMRPGYLQSCVIGIFTINAMFLSRFFMWQYFYQVLYAILPCMFLASYFNRNAHRMQASARRLAMAGNYPRRRVEGVRGPD